MNYQRLVKELRKKLILSQEEFAKLLGVSFASINRLESGRHEPTIKIKRKIVELCNYILAPSKYIEFIDHDLNINYEEEMKRIQEEMKIILKNEKKSQQLLVDAFRGIGYEIDED